ncbi:MAG TPA: hypothetical protein VMH03_16610 [Terriglobales bacterium]|nr:hypothetical protein [Terriglobales bacterium]
MPGHNIRALETLRLELKLVELGYRASTPGRPLSVLEEAPICLRCQVDPCTNCALIKFVPYAGRCEPVPCHHIRLNQAHETIDSLYRTGTQQELEEALREWLIATIQRLEQEEIPLGNRILTMSLQNSAGSATEGGLRDKPCSAN